MTVSEQETANRYKRIGEVSSEECFVGGHNCGTCAHCRDHNADWVYFDHSYCTMAPVEGYDKKANMMC